MRIARVAAIGLAVTVALATHLAADLTRNRSIAFYNIHTKETVSVQYKKDGRIVPEAMQQIDWVLRDWRRDEATKMDPTLVDLLWEIHAELGSREPIHVVSGFRSSATNEMLRRTVGGQASQSRHITGQAVDVHFPDVPLRSVRYAALVRELGGVGYYPTSALPFVHVDTGNVRHWPRLPRHELALLFPSGRTRHQPADGGPIDRDDVRTARARHQDLAIELAAFHDLRASGAARTAVAASTAAPIQRASAVAGPPPGRQMTALAPARAPTTEPVPPRLVAEPRLVDRPTQLTARLTSRPTEDERSKLAVLAALASATPTLISAPRPAEHSGPALPSLTGRVAGAAPVPADGGEQAQRRLAALEPEIMGASERFGWGAGWARAPEYDDEHPEELSYRPFPISPYLTTTPSPDDSALIALSAPDVMKTLELLDQAGSMPPMQIRPGQQTARLLWALTFRGEAADRADLMNPRPPAPGAPSGRLVQTQAP